MKYNESTKKARTRQTRILNLTANPIKKKLRKEFDTTTEKALSQYKKAGEINNSLYTDHEKNVYNIAYDGLIRGQDLGARGLLNTFVLGGWIDKNQSKSVLLDFQLKIRQYAIDNADFLARKVAEKTKDLINKIIEKNAVLLETNSREKNSFIDDLIAGAMAEAKETNIWRSVISAFAWGHSSNQEGVSSSASIVEQNYPLELLKVWITMKDEKVRDTHQPMEGVAVPTKEPFMVPTDGGSEPMMYPGDMSASIGNWINCRCVKRFKIDE